MADVKPIMRDTLMPKGGQRRGRPPVAEPLTPVTSWVPPAVANRLDRMATKQDMSVSQLVCRLLILRVR